MTFPAEGPPTNDDVLANVSGLGKHACMSRSNNTEAFQHDRRDKDFQEEIILLAGGSRHIEVAPPRRGLTLRREVTGDRIRAAVNNFHDGDPKQYQMNWTLSLHSGPEAFFPRRYGIPLDRIEELLRRHDPYELALSIRSDGDPKLTSRSITRLTIRIFKDRRSDS